MIKKLRPGEIRFIAKQIDKLWRVYDRARGSYPYHMPELGGEILQDTDKKSAEAEAERLNGKYGPKLEQKKEKKQKKAGIETVEVDTSTDEAELPELPDYGVLSEEEAAKYEEGLMEKVKY